jgi:hypothetical protein
LADQGGCLVLSVCVLVHMHYTHLHAYPTWVHLQIALCYILQITV